MRHIISKKNRALLSEMIRTDFKLKYQGSFLGYLWSLLKPLMLFAILYVVFTQFLRIGQGIPNYPISLLLGIVLWNFFAEASSASLKSVVSKGSLIRKISIPRWLIPVSSITTAFITLLLNLLVVFVFILFADDIPLSFMSLAILPLLLVELLVVSLTVGFFLSAVFVKFRDMEHIWEVVRQALFYVTPIIYPLVRVPNELAQKVLILNPLAQIIQDARSLITYGDALTIRDIYGSQLITFVPLIILLAAAVLTALFFRSKSKTFAEDI